MTHNVLVVGGGMAGLTTAAFLAKAGLSVTLCETQDSLGGLVASFERGGFTFDAGIRAIENSGIVRPMLKALDIALDFLPSTVSVGIGSQVARLTSEESLKDYQGLLEGAFPESRADIARIIAELRRVMDYMDVLYGIDNPLFLDLKGNTEYLRTTLLPWMLRYLRTMPKVAKLLLPVETHLATLSGNQALLDLVDQHFFKATPAYFALSYFSLYLDYAYPKGGTGQLPKALVDYLREKQVQIKTGARIVALDTVARIARDAAGQEYPWDRLVWTADQKALYKALDQESLPPGLRKRIHRRQAAIEKARGGDSIFTLYVSSSLPPSYFQARASAHFFYTPSTKGLSACGPKDWKDRAGLEAWARDYLGLTTYEISFPALRDPSLAPPGQTGLIVSSLMDYDFFARAKELGLYEEIKDFCKEIVLGVLEGSIFPELKGGVLEASASTPLSIEGLTGNSDGAITGWAFTNPRMPAVHKLPRVTKSIQTLVPGIYQAGQWTFSPSGLPISILTGKLAADRVAKDLGKA